jgi:hypothetical protein
MNVAKLTANVLGACVSTSLAALSICSMLGAISCASHAFVSTASPSASSEASTALSSSVALASMSMFGIFIGGIHVALRLASLLFAILLLLLHFWLRVTEPSTLVAAADWISAHLLSPARRSLDLGREWDCIFFGVTDSLYMLAAARHAASVLASLRTAIGNFPALGT